MHKERIAVLRGGPSEEHEVSLKSGAAVIAALERSERYVPLDVTINTAGQWLMHGRVYEQQDIFAIADKVFIALHGTYGEDGTVQRILERHRVPFTGSGSFSSAVAMHKSMTKDLLRTTDVRMPKHVFVSQEEIPHAERVAAHAADVLGTACVVKPVRSGSSFGVRMVSTTLELEQVLREVLPTYGQVLIEERITGIEATCGVIDDFRGEELYALPEVEIVLSEHSPFFDFSAKYQGGTTERCPGRFTEQIKHEMARVAKLAHTTLQLRGYSRTDCIIAADTVYFLEVNTLPGLTEQSLVPQELAAVGVSLLQFIEHQLEHAHW